MLKSTREDDFHKVSCFGCKENEFPYIRLFDKKRLKKETQMSKIAGKKAKRQRERRAKKIKIINLKRRHKKKQWKGKKLTSDEKKIRSEKLKRREYEKKKQRAEKEQKHREYIENRNISNLNKILFKCFDQERLNSLAKSTEFIKRQTASITSFAFIYVLSFGFFGNGAISLACLTAGLRQNFDILITLQALSKRINRRQSVKFIKSVLSELLIEQLKYVLNSEQKCMFSYFSGVIVEDSTQVSLHEYLTPSFEGSGGGASQSAVKLNLIYDIKNILILGVKLTSGIVSDKTNNLEILACIKSKMLIIRDLGYFSLRSLKQIHDASAYFLSRLPHNLNVYLNDNDNDDDPIDILKLFNQELSDDKASLDLNVYLGKGKTIKTRLIAERVPLSVIHQRTKRYKKEYKKEPATYYVEWNGYSIFITNLPRIFSAPTIIAFYKIRWRIELIFKNLKSNLEIDVLKGTNPHRIECLIYGRLIVLVTTVLIHKYAANSAKDREVSEDKLTKWLKSDRRLQRAVLSGHYSEILKQLDYDLDLVSKQKRFKKTTLEIVDNVLMQTGDKEKLDAA